LKSLSVDLIFGRPEQTVDGLMEELDTLLTLYPDIPHLSVYQLTLERGTETFVSI
jgi:coproporphyrinogen III oxidase-like Fe-S oxidoreductase